LTQLAEEDSGPSRIGRAVIDKPRDVSESEGSEDNSSRISPNDVVVLGLRRRELPLTRTGGLDIAMIDIDSISVEKGRGSSDPRLQ
jgi:hypothetical protein